jgi:hypothetical protein
MNVFVDVKRYVPRLSDRDGDEGELLRVRNVRSRNRDDEAGEIWTKRVPRTILNDATNGALNDFITVRGLRSATVVKGFLASCHMQLPKPKSKTNDEKKKRSEQNVHYSS